MNDKNNSNILITEKDILQSYSEYFQLIKKYKDKFKDANIQKDSQINIKSLILDYLNFKYENGEKWIKNLISLVKQKQFLSQNALISIFYLDVYDIIIKPKILNQSLSEKLYPQSALFSYKIIKNNGDTDPTIIYKIKKQEAYELFDVIKRQIEYKENPFNIVINNYINLFLKEIQYKIKYLDKMQENKDYNIICQKIFEELKEQINEFTILLTKCITLLYRINNIQEYDTYYALLISIIFNGKGNSKKLYQLLMNIIERKEKNKIDNFKKIIFNYKNKNMINPENFAIEDKFCLNDKSKILYEKLFQKEYKINNNKENIPYENTINNYRKIKEYQNPFDKLLLTMNLSKIIKEEISQFWGNLDENELKDKKIKLNIEADDFISIFKYMLIKGEIEDIYSQIYFIESFTSNQIKSESEWYYLSLIQVSLMQLEEMKEI